MEKLHRHILIVEDEIAMQNAISKVLVDAGFDIETAGDGAEGLEKAWESHPDLILLDILMPQMNGVTMFQKLRQDPWGSEVPVIVLTVVSADEEIQSKITELKPAYYLVKTSEHLEDLVDKVKEVLGLA